MERPRIYLGCTAILIDDDVTHTHARARARTHAHTNTHAHAHARTHIRIYIYIYNYYNCDYIYPIQLEGVMERILFYSHYYESTEKDLKK